MTPIIGKEYDYLDTIVKVLEVIPCKGLPEDEWQVRFVTRFAQQGTCEAGELSERRKQR